MSLPLIYEVNLHKVQEFYIKILRNVNILDTLGKMKESNGYVQFTLHKFSGIRADLVRVDDNWQGCCFPEFIEVPQKWMERNPKPNDVTKESHVNQKNKLFQTKRNSLKQCIFIAKKAATHKGSDCVLYW